jgi:hypothetical protein
VASRNSFFFLLKKTKKETTKELATPPKKRKGTRKIKTFEGENAHKKGREMEILMPPSVKKKMKEMNKQKKIKNKQNEKEEYMLSIRSLEPEATRSPSGLQSTQ